MPLRLAPRERRVGGLVVRRVVGAEEQRHDQPDADAEGEREQEARDGEVGADDAAGVDERQDVGRGREEQEGDRRAEPGALAVDAREERHDRARAHGQQRTGRGRGGIGDGLRALRPRKRVIDSLGISAAIAPAMKNAGSRHSSTCAAR